MRNSKHTAAASDRKSSGRAEAKTWTRPTVSVVAASSAELAVAPTLDGGDTFS